MQIKNLLQNKRFFAFVFGGISTFAFAPFNFIIAALVGFSAILLITDGIKEKKEIFKISWCFGFGHFLIGLYWISISLLVDVAKFAWLIPFSISLIPALAACYIGLAILFTNLIAIKLQLNKSKKILLLAIIWVFFEYIRSNFIFGGFPWNQIGYIFMFNLEISQLASIVGIYGLSILAIIICCLPSLFIKIKDEKLSFVLAKESYLILFSCLIVLGLSWIYGSHLLNKPNYQKSIKLRLVQPAIKQENKWDQRSRYKSFMENIILSKQPGLEEIDYLIWSESAVPYIIDKDNEILLKEISKAIPSKGFLITGGLRAEFKDQNLKEINKVWNSIFIIDSVGNIINSYDKHRLVPFGEYIPFAQFLPFISKITDGAVGFSTGNGPQTIKVSDNLPSFSPLICYEVIYTDKIIDKNNPPQFFVNLTNDAWFGNSSGPYQHFAMARMRAIEYGIPLVRVANTGISAIIDSHGRIIKQKNLGEKGIVDVELKVNSNHSTYGQNDSNYLLMLVYFILLLILL